MPTITTFDPLSVASEAIGSFVDAKRKKALEDAAQTEQQRQAARQTERDQRSDLESDRSYDLSKGAATDTHSRAVSDLASADQTRRITEANNAFEEKMRPLVLEHQKIQNKLDAGQAVTADDTHKLRQYEIKQAAIATAIAQKFGVPMAAFSLKQGQAALNATNAQTGLTQAETYRTMHPVVAGPRTSASERSQDSYANAIESLSPAGIAFANKLFSSASPPTRAQAMLALQAAATGHGKDALAQSDIKNLRTVIENKLSQFATPGEQVNSTRSDHRASDRSAQRLLGVTAAAVMRNQSVRQLPPVDQADLAQGLSSVGVDGTVKRLREAAAGGKVAGLDQERATRMLNALGAAVGGGQ